jgi:glycosyltransferase involved in cell wall biosynthesis
MNIAGISVIICVYNGSKRIVPTLQALATQHVAETVPCEIILVDNASTDGTTATALGEWDKLGAPYPLNVIQENRPGKANALVAGYNAARYEYMLLCDDDNWLQPDYFGIVIELFAREPEIGMLGGYGQALFEEGQKPDWFDKWESCYVCGKHHKKNGFMVKDDFSIWGAGSVLRKTFWDFLVSKGFRFINSTGSGKAMTEDAELSMAISFTAHRLYFDERLWFTHDLRGGRITWKNLIEQQSLNGKNSAILSTYRLTRERIRYPWIPFSLLFAKKIAGLIIHLTWALLKINFKPRWIYFYHNLKELVLHPGVYAGISKSSAAWISSILETSPLNEESGLKKQHLSSEQQPNG